MHLNTHPYKYKIAIALQSQLCLETSNISYIKGLAQYYCNFLIVYKKLQ